MALGTFDPAAGPNDVSQTAGFGYRYGKLQSVGGLVLHHTGDNHDLKQGIADAHDSNLGAQYRMERDGTVSRIAPSGAKMNHMMNGSGPLGQGRSNHNMEGIEVVAKSDADMTEAQKAALPQFIGWHAQQYGYDPAKDVLGHSDVNPGHRTNEMSEFANAIRSGTIPLGGAPASLGPTEVPDSGLPKLSTLPMPSQPPPTDPNAPVVAAAPKPAAPAPGLTDTLLSRHPAAGALATAFGFAPPAPPAPAPGADAPPAQDPSFFGSLTAGLGEGGGDNSAAQMAQATSQRSQQAAAAAMAPPSAESKSKDAAVKAAGMQMIAALRQRLAGQMGTDQGQLGVGQGALGTGFFGSMTG